MLSVLKTYEVLVNIFRNLPFYFNFIQPIFNKLKYVCVLQA